MKAKKVVDGEGRFVGIRIICPGCGDKHVLPVRPTPHGEIESPHYATHAHWHFNGDYKNPTLSPSVHVRTGHFASHSTDKDECWCTYYKEHPEESKDFSCYVCHSFIRNGTIEYLNDCTHALAGKTVPLPDFE